MNPFRRLWTRELGLYVTALALLVQILMAVGHVGIARAGALDGASFCTVDTGTSHDSAAMAETCPLCHLPDPLALKPRDPSLMVALVWTQIVYAPVQVPGVTRPEIPTPFARGPPLPV